MGCRSDGVPCARRRGIRTRPPGLQPSGLPSCRLPLRAPVPLLRLFLLIYPFLLLSFLFLPFVDDTGAAQWSWA